MSRRGALTVEVTVSSFSSYVAFLEGYARALVAAETGWDKARTWLREAVRSARAEVRLAPDQSPLGAISVSFPGVRSDRDVSRLAGDVFAGSEPSLMERMLGPRRPFYKAGPVMRLEKIPPDEFAAFIDVRFARSGLRPEAGLGAAGAARRSTTCTRR